jgi:uncharacterized protein
VNGLYRRFAVAWLVSVAVACTSAPLRYYTLTPPSDKIAPASQTPLAIDVRVVRTSPQLNRSELMVRSGPTELTLLENERWASPVNDEIKDAVRQELRRALARTAGPRPAFTKLTLDIDVQHLEAELGRYALLEASWRATLSATGSNVVRATTCTFQADEKIRAGYAGVVEGYQREIAALADTIVAVLTSPANDIDAPCQQSTEGSADGSGS